jgi:magnesium transporter
MADMDEGLIVSEPEGEEEAGRSAAVLSAVGEALAAEDRARLASLVSGFEDADFADLLALLDKGERVQLIRLLGGDFPLSVLSEVDYAVKEQLVEALPNAQVADAVRELESDDAVYLIEDMAPADQAEILAQLPADERATLERSLEYPEQSAGRLMQADVIAVPPFWNVGQVIDHMREADDLPDAFSEIYVVDPSFHLLGIVHLDRLLRTKRPVAIREIMEEDPHAIPVALDQEEVARQFERHNLMAAPVVDANERLVGVVTADDVVEVVQEEAEEDIYRLGGVGDESVSDSFWSITKSRFAWLFVNLLTAILASVVISLFDATIGQMVALAVLMPIVASMGGNAGTQTMTVAVRALATKDLSAVNALRVVWRESAVGLANGLMFALIMGLVALLWFGSGQLGLVIGAAMVVNLVAAALAGILIPIALERAGIDPAVASGVFVTTVTDVVGFFAFLGLAALWLVN